MSRALVLVLATLPLALAFVPSARFHSAPASRRRAPVVLAAEPKPGEPTVTKESVQAQAKQDVRRDADGFIVKEDLAYIFSDGDLSSNLGASAVKLPQECTEFIDALAGNEKVTFDESMAMIDGAFSCVPVTFKNGDVENSEGTNVGSSKVFSFARLAGLDAEQTLTLFGEHYRGVKADPSGTDHANIRAFMSTGCGGSCAPVIPPCAPSSFVFPGSKTARRPEQAGGPPRGSRASSFRRRRRARSPCASSLGSAAPACAWTRAPHTKPGP